MKQRQASQRTSSTTFAGEDFPDPVNDPNLTFDAIPVADYLLLVALNTDTGKVRLSWPLLEFALGGGLLAELELHHAISVAPDGIVLPVRRPRLTDPILRLLHRTIAEDWRNGHQWPASLWVEYAGELGRHLVPQRLASAGRITITRDPHGARRYPAAVAARLHNTTRAPLLAIAISLSQVDLKPICAIAALADAGGLLPFVYPHRPPDEGGLARLRRQLATHTHLDALVSAVAQRRGGRVMAGTR